MGAMEINYLDKRNPIMSIIWSLFMPGLGQLYIHRIIMLLFLLLHWTVVSFTILIFFEAISLLFLGEIQKATNVLNPEWLLFSLLLLWVRHL